jgi:hypothetical protein
MGIVFLVLTLTAFIPGAFSFPGSAWERQGRAAPPLQERLQAGRAGQAGRPRAEPGYKGNCTARRAQAELGHEVNPYLDLPQI